MQVNYLSDTSWQATKHPATVPQLSMIALHTCYDQGRSKFAGIYLPLPGICGFLWPGEAEAPTQLTTSLP